MKSSFVYLLVLLLLASFLRVYNLDKVPPSLFGDEVDVGYQAYSLLKTGKDLQGNFWPTLIHSLSEYRAPLFIYSDVPFIAVFGLSEWGVRLPAAFFGVLGVLGIFLLTRRLFNERIGLLAAGFLTISPWHIQYSRAAFEVTMLLSFLIFAVYFFIKGLEKKYYLVLSAILFGLTPYIYSTAVLFTPTLILFLLCIYRREIKSKMTNFAIAFLVSLLILCPYGLQTLSGKSGERFGIVSVFTNQHVLDKVLLAQQSESQISSLARVFHNKPLAFTEQISMNYLRSFSPEFLFLRGDPNARHSVGEMGEMYYFESILFLLGTWWIIGKSEVGRMGKWVILGWLIVAPMPAALTYDGGFHATRSFLMLPPLVILLSLGVNYLFENIKNVRIKYLTVIVLVLAVFNVVFYFHRYFVHYPTEQWRAWHFGFKEAMQYVDANKLNYDRILINNTYEPSLIRFLFWTKYDPKKFHQQFRGDQPLKNITTGFDGFSLEEKYFFGKVNGPFEPLMNSRTLYLASARDDITNPATLLAENVKLLETSYSLTGEPVFYLITGFK